MDEIDWESVIKHCHWAASQGEPVTELFGVEPSVDVPVGYAGMPTLWPSQQQAVTHQGENPDMWEVVDRGYEWRRFALWDMIHDIRKRGARGDPDFDWRGGKVAIDACFNELRMIEARVAEREKRENPKERGAISDRLRRAKQKMSAERAETRNVMDEASNVGTFREKKH